MNYKDISSIGEQRAMNELLNSFEEGLGDQESFCFELMLQLIHDYEKERVVKNKRGTTKTGKYLLQRLLNLCDKAEGIKFNDTTGQKEKVNNFFYYMFDKIVNDVFEDLTIQEKLEVLSMYYK